MLAEAELIDQLFYAWAPRGVEGMNRFQIVALSPGLRNERAEVMSSVRKICRLDRTSSGDSSLSFGWFDQQDTRIAFLRLPVTTELVTGHSFAAHVLVGSPAILSGPAIASRFDAPFWWTGDLETVPTLTVDKANTELPRLTLADLPTAASEPAPPDGLTRAIAYALLTRRPRRPITVALASRPAAEQLRTLAATCPELVDGIAVSTFERRPPVPFDLLAQESAGGREAVGACGNLDLDPASAAAIDLLLARTPISAELRRIARSAADRSPTDPTRYWTTARLLVAATSREGAEAWWTARLDPAAAAYVASSANGAASLGAAVAAGDQAARQVLAAIAGELTPEARYPIWSAAGTYFDEHQTLAGISDLVELLGVDLNTDTPRFRIVFDRAREAAQAATLSAADLLTVLSAAADRAVRRAELGGPLMDAAANHLLALAGASRVPFDYVLDAVEHAAAKGQLDARSIAAVERRRAGVVLRARLAPELLDVLVGELRSLPLDDLLAVLPVALRRFGQVGQVSTVIHQALGRLSLQQAATVLCTFCGSKAIPTTPLTSELLDTVAGNVLDELPEGVISAQAMLAGSGSPAARQALALLDRVHMGGAAAVGQHELDRIDNDDLRAGVTVAVRRSALSRFNTVNDLNSIWFAPSLAAYATTGERLRTLFGDLNLVRLNSSRCHTLLEWIVCDVIQQDPDFLGGRLTPALRDLACQETCIRLAGRIPLERWMFDPPRIEHLDRRSRAWWNSFKPSTPKASR